MSSTYTELSAHRVASAEPPQHGQRFIRDTLISGFALRITATGAKSYVLEAWVNGRSRRLTLGKHPALSLKDARKKAKQALGKFALGRDIVAERRAERARSVTLAEVFDAYLASRSLKDKTLRDYRHVLAHDFADWQKKPVVSITKDMVSRRHQQLTERGPARANLAMRVLRALLNYAAARYEDEEGRSIIVENPVKRLSATKSWNRVDRRRGVIKAHQLPAWFDAVMALQSEHPLQKTEVARDYLLFLMLTGLRREEAARLCWRDVDLDTRTFVIPDTKNREAHELPLSDFLLELLLSRRKDNADNVDFVFPGEGRTGHLIDPRKQMARVTAASGVEFRLHDLRRTFITIAESLDIPAYALKRLLNHKSGADVTAGYIVIDVERLRTPMQKITDFILKTAGARPAAEVVTLTASARQQ